MRVTAPEAGEQGLGPHCLAIVGEADLHGAQAGLQLGSRALGDDASAELGLTLGEMKALLSLDAGAAKPNAGVAERRGLPEDRRIKTVTITPTGEKIKAELLRRIYEPGDEVLSLSRADLLDLIEVLRKLVPSAAD
ncbi:MAG TPA: hypothetical protein VK988_02035 [Acidimicrobiales bacterium]|nr:hypothetical protein [Acidimicrobiales bacterium]